jgi:hypothetical protein
MKTLITILYTLACIVIIGVSHYFWVEKTTALEAAKSNNGVASSSYLPQQTMDKLLPFTKNWPKTSVETFKQAIKQQRPFKIVIAGSPALGGEKGWAAETKRRLLETYGDHYVSVNIKEYDLNSADFIRENKHQELADLQPDMLILEPFILKSNGVVAIEDSLDYLTTLIETVKHSSPQCTVILQPAHPIYKAKIYPNQIALLKQYAEEQQIPYLDHWGIWPNPDTEEIKQYLSPDQSQPNERGHKVWGKFVSAYLISNE